MTHSNTIPKYGSYYYPETLEGGKHTVSQVVGCYFSVTSACAAREQAKPIHLKDRNGFIHSIWKP